MAEYIENRKREALGALHATLKIFWEPHVRIMGRLAKCEKELKELREKYKASEDSLRKCRTKRQELRAQCENTQKENSKLKQRIDQLEDSLAFYEEATGKGLQKK
jgi:chromosome segregation ATPase